MELKIVLPERSQDEISDGLRTLTKHICKTLNLDTGYGLGGEFGYGVDYENDTFMMHHFCWCEQENCPWCGGCQCALPPEEYVDGERVESWYSATSHMIPAMPSEDGEFGSPAYKAASQAFDAAIKARNARIKIVYPEVTHKCGHGWAIDLPRREVLGPSDSAPNFWHKPTGFKVWWYKYIGRSMEFYGECDWRAVQNECAASVAPPLSSRR